jgi:excisionase family DNA binding protein
MRVSGTMSPDCNRVNAISKRLFSLKDAATYLGRTVWGVRELVWNGRIPVIREGRKYYIDVKDLDAYVENNKTVMI